MNGLKKKYKRPQLGVKPKYIWEEQVEAQRKADIQDAVIRHFEADEPINLEWVEEYNELVEKGNK